MVIFEKTAALKKILLTVACCISSWLLVAQSRYWQQEVNYQLDVTLNDTARTLDGFLILDYKNHSPDTLRFIWFHLWSNAYKNDRTAFSDQFLKIGRTDFYFSKQEERGYINRLDFSAGGRPLRVIDHPEHQDIVQVELAQPLIPGASVTIRTPFHVKIPKLFSRGGYWDNAFYLTQWYPKPAVYDAQGWHPMPYLDQGEFYSEFGDFNVQINIPKSYQVAAGGFLTDSTVFADQRLKTYRYRLQQAHDFAWFADPLFIKKEDTLQLDGDRGVVQLKAYFLPGSEKAWSGALEVMRKTIRDREALIGPYPYGVAIAVESRKPGEGGMEYPGITLIDGRMSGRALDEVISHEIGHNWFYGALASNERAHPWLDEGLNSYYDRRFMTNRPTERIDKFAAKRFPPTTNRYLLGGLEKLQLDQPIQTPSEQFGFLQYGLIAYEKTADWLELLEKRIGRARFDAAMQQYFRDWRYKHPQPTDFKASLEASTGQSLTDWWTASQRIGPLDSLPPIKRKIKWMSWFGAKDLRQYHYVGIAPAIGYNQYDKVMVGAVLHNLQYPGEGFQFLVAPMFATGSKALTGTANLQYHILRKSDGRRISIGLAAARFHGNDFTDSANKRTALQFQKIVPSITWHFKQTPGSSRYGFIQAKSFLIQEQGLRFTRDTINQQDVIRFPSFNRYVNQLRVVLGDTRALYPWDAEFQVDQGRQFVRLAFTGNYHFNYASGGGLDLRVFAGKFFYTVDRTFQAQFETDLYHLNLTGPKGKEDYTYRNYFVGRSAFEGWASQQIMNRDGFFKVRTDLLSAKVGKTDNWLAAMNFSTDIPSSINPLQVLPIKIPIRLFADIGTFAEAWDRNAGTPRFLYDAGLELPLFENTVRIFVPLIYSKVYKDYFLSTITEKRFWRNISFSIDVHRLNARKVMAPIPF